MGEKIDQHQYQWIINEGLLRDEGVLFGLAGAAIEDKIGAIRDYYRVKKAPSEAKREQLGKEIRMVVDESLASWPGDGLGATVGTSAARINLVPVILQLCLYSGICYFNFYFETYWLSPVIRSSAICMGLYLFGLFSVFLGRSILYNSIGSLVEGQNEGERREKWKIYLEEWGVPVVVSLFIAVLPGQAYPLVYSVVAALFFFLLFLLGGKGLVNTFFRLRSEAGWYFRRRRQTLQSAKLRLLQDELTGILSALAELTGEEEYKIHILTSEYRLAKENRQLAAIYS